MMKLLLAGTFLPGRIEVSYERAFRKLGCCVSRFEIGEANRLLAPFWEQVINKRILAAVTSFKPDLILIMKGYHLWPKTIKKIQGLGKALIFCFIGDNPFDISPTGSSSKNILQAIPYYDCYLIWTRSLIEPLIENGARKTMCLPFGFDASLHYPIAISEAERECYRNDIIFVGNWDEERERCLRGLADLNLNIWGEDYWRRRCRDRNLREKWKRKALYCEDMSRALFSSKISLNIFRKQNKENHNMRTFEIPAAGAFALSEASLEAKEFFTEDKEAVYFSTPQELREKCQYYLKKDRERQEIALSGYRRCLKSGYSYLDRAKQILKVFGEHRRC